MHFDCEYPDEANGTAYVSVISKEDWLSEIGAEVINHQNHFKIFVLLIDQCIISLMIVGRNGI